MSQDLKQKLVTANRVLANEGITQGTGHVSVREPGAEELYISVSRSPQFVTEEDIIRMDFDGNVLSRDDAHPYKETVIHRAIYRNRDDVNAVVHHHAPAVIPFSATDVELKPIVHFAPFRGSVPVFDEFEPEWGRMIVSESEGERMVASLGDRRAQLIAGHGGNVTGSSIEEALLATFGLVLNAQFQLQAELLGTPRFLTDEGADAYVTVGPIDRLWEYLRRRLPGNQ